MNISKWVPRPFRMSRGLCLPDLCQLSCRVSCRRVLTRCLEADTFEATVTPLYLVWRCTHCVLPPLFTCSSLPLTVYWLAGTALTVYCPPPPPHPIAPQKVKMKLLYTRILTLRLRYNITNWRYFALDGTAKHQLGTFCAFHLAIFVWQDCKRI